MTENITTTTKEQRRQQVATMRSNFNLEGMEPDAEDLAWQERYIEGTASLTDLLTYATAFAKEHRRRVAAQKFAIASVALEGFTVSEDVQEKMRRMAMGELKTLGIAAPPPKNRDNE